MSEQPSKPQAKKLSAIQTMRLGAKLEEYRDEIAPDKMTAAETITAVVPHLDFIPTESSVKNLCEQLGIKLKGHGDRGPRRPAVDLEPVMEQLEKIRRELSGVKAGLAQLIAAFDDARNRANKPAA